MEPLQRTATVALRALLDGQPTTPAKVAFAWRIAAGPALARAGTPRWTDDGTLRVRPRDAAWRRELQHARPVVVERMAQLLGPNVVKRLVVDDA
jgi:hypothetical protein